MSGVTVNMPQFLTDTHVIKNRKSVRRYLSRLAEFGRVLRETHERVTDDRANGVIPLILSSRKHCRDEQVY